MTKKRWKQKNIEQIKNNVRHIAAGDLLLRSEVDIGNKSQREQHNAVVEIVKIGIPNSERKYVQKL